MLNSLVHRARPAAGGGGELIFNKTPGGRERWGEKKTRRGEERDALGRHDATPSLTALLTVGNILLGNYQKLPVLNLNWLSAGPR